MSAPRDGQEGPADPVEIEWQFDALDLRPVERWLATLPTLAVDTDGGGTVTALARTPRRLVDSYLDTEDWRIARAGFVVRTRKRGRQDEITLKDTRPAEEGGLRKRLEVTEELPADGPDALGPEGPVGRRVRAIVGSHRLREVLQVRTRRRPFALRIGGVDAAEVALDDTVIVVGAGQRPMQLRRVEVEVRPEWFDALEPIVAQLRISCGLQPASLSKFEAGLLALGHEVPGSPELGATDISTSSTMGDLAFAVLRRQLRVLFDKEPGTRLGEDVEELHDMRVATRRLRAALALFTGVLPVRAQAFRQELGWLARVLGAVRDLDVQLEGLADSAPVPPPQMAVAGHDPLADLVALLERDREDARGEMLRALDSVRWERLAKGMAAMAQQGPARRSLAARVPAVIAMPDLVLARHDAVRKAAKRAKKTRVVSDFHRVRIRGKRLRYSLEFSAELYDGRTSRYVRQLAGLQDELGNMQDAEVAANRLAELATGEGHLPAATVFAMGGMAERHHQDVARLLRGLPKELARVGGREWRDLWDVMERRRAEEEALRPPGRSTLRAVPTPPSTPSTFPSDTGSAAEDEAAPEVEPGHGPEVPSAGGHGHPAGSAQGPSLTALAPPPPSRQGE